MGLVALVLLGIVLLVMVCSHSNQAFAAVPMKVSFQGEYKVGDGDWNPIVKGESISAMDGDVTLKGYFQLESPDGKEVVGHASKGAPIALYLNHIHCDLTVNGENYPFSAEEPLIGVSACGKQWVTYEYTGTETDTVEIVLKNSHRFGNHNAVNEFLDSMYIDTSVIFEDLMLDEGRAERTAGFVVIVVSLAMMGVAVFSALLRLRQSKCMCLLGFQMFFAGVCMVFDSKNIYFWSNLVVFNSYALQISRMLYTVFAMCLIVMCLSDKVKKIGTAAVSFSGLTAGVLLSICLFGGKNLFDISIFWTAALILVGIVLLGCCIYNLFHAEKRQILLLAFCITGITALLMDIGAEALGWWSGGLLSQIVFGVLFVLTLIIVLKIIPSNIRSSIREKELQAELQNNRISIMLSQIQPHFMFNSISAIRELCRIDPEQAREALGDFSIYLRGNMDSLNCQELIYFSKELAHIEAYLKLEKMRFGDSLHVVYDIQESDFFLPALTIQPMVENAVKHGLCAADEGGTVTIRTCRKGDDVVISVIDDGVGFVPEEQTAQDGSRTHVGIDNVRNRLEHMANGELFVESAPGKGTTVTIVLHDEKEEQSDL